MRIETYKGIEFVRISSMPEEQQVLIHKTLDKSKIIKILRDSELLNDCIQTTTYNEWMGIERTTIQEVAAANPVINELRLAYK